jgi:hypothetical protein
MMSQQQEGENTAPNPRQVPRRVVGWLRQRDGAPSKGLALRTKGAFLIDNLEKFTEMGDTVSPIHGHILFHWSF